MSAKRTMLTMVLLVTVTWVGFLILGLRQDGIVGNRSTRALSRSGGLEMMPDLHSSAPKRIADGVSDARMPMQKRYISPLLTNSTLV